MPRPSGLREGSRTIHRIAGATAVAAAVLVLSAVSAPARSRAVPSGVTDRAGTSLDAMLDADLARGDGDELEARLTADSDEAPSILARLGDRLAAAAQPERTAIGRLATSAFRARLRRLANEPPPAWGSDAPRRLLALALLDPRRFGVDESFRRSVVAAIPLAELAALPATLRDATLYALAARAETGFEAFEEVVAAAGAVPRSSRARAIAGEGAVAETCGDGGDRPIEASLYVLGSDFFEPADAARFLAAVTRLAPARTLLVVADRPMRDALAADPALARVRFVESWGRPYSPWPRDPLLFCRRPDGGVTLVERPNRQPGREADSDLARALVEGLPDDLDARWGRVRWTTAPVPFHNGQVLLANGDAWISIHTLELPILERLGLDRVPVAEFSSAAGIARYTAAARETGAELGRFYGATPRFVHPLATAGSLAARATLMRTLGGGAGFDLDSLVTVLPGSGAGAPAALIADIGEGIRLLGSASPADLAELRETYRLAPGPAALREALVEAQSRARPAALEAFLDLVAHHLESTGLRVGRLPLLLVPTGLLEDHRGMTSADFQLTWANIVLERRDGRLRAEGFASRFAPGDRAATDAFRAMGCELHLLPTLVHSIVLDGGYRCASNHLRKAIR